MDSDARPRHPISAGKRPDPPLESPAKGTSMADQVWTPEKPARLPRRSGNRSIAFSVKEVRKVALGLQTAADRSDHSRSGNDDDLQSVEQQLGASSVPGFSPKSSKARGVIKLPEKYEILCEFFNCMESSIRLLRLKGSMCTFANILSSIQHLTERRFTYAHLAQLKYIMPEAIIIKKVILHDEATCCMKPELQVTLQVDAVAKNINGKTESGYSILRKVFRERIVGFNKEHPEGDDVPEEQLPHPFNQTKPSVLPIVSNASAKLTCTKPSSSTTSHQQFSVPSHLSQSFQRRFSRKFPTHGSEQTPLMSFGKACPKDDLSVPLASSPSKCNLKPPIYRSSMLGSPISSTISSTCGTGEEKTQKFIRTDNFPHKEQNVKEGTPARLVSTPLRLMSNTPDMPTPKRCRTTSSCDSPPLNKSVKRSTRTKLFMTPTKSAKAGDEEYGDRSLSADDDILNIIPESLLQSIKEKERKTAQEEEAGVSNAIRRQTLIASLPSIFDMILLIFQSWKRSVMTKNELIYKLLSSNCKIVDRGEVEEQLKLLFELVPDWISEKIASSGDILLSVGHQIQKRFDKGEGRMEAGTLSIFAILLIILADANAILGVDSLMDQGNMAYNMNGKSNPCSSCLEASRHAQKSLDDLILFSDIRSLSSEACHILPSQLKNKCLDKSQAHIDQAQFFLQHLFHEGSLCNNTGLCLDESFSPDDDILTSLINESTENGETTCHECSRAIRNIIEGAQSAKVRKKMRQLLVEQCEEHHKLSEKQPSWTPATRPIVTGQRRASDSRAFYSQRTPKPPPPTSAKIDAAASIEQAPPKPSVFDPPSPVSDLNPRRVPPPTPPFHFLIRPFVVEALTNVHPAASDPQISTARAASLNASKDMAKQRQLFSTHDASPRSFKSREWDSMSRWSEYISLEELSSSTPMNGRSLGSDAPPNSGTVPKALHMEWVDKLAMDTLTVNAQDYFQKLEPWVMLLLDLMAFREQALRVILDLSSTVITLLPHQNSLILHAFMDLFCSFVRVNLFSDKIPRKMMLQLYNMLHTILKGGRDCELYHRLVQFVDSYDPPVKGLQEDLNFVSPRIGEVLEAVGPIIFLSTDTKKMRNEGFLSPFHPRYPDILTNSAHPMVVLKEHLVLTLFRDEYELLHEDYQCYVLPRILESKKLAKSGRAKQKEADLEYNVAKQVEKMISEVHEQALMSCNAIHRERRILLKQEIGRMMVFSALSLAQSEVIWYFQHVGIPSSKFKSVRAIPIEIDAADPTIGFLLDGKDKLCHLVRKYMAAIKGYALSYLSSSAGRIRFLLGTPGMVALDIDSTLKNLFQQVVHCLENIPKPQGETVSSITCDLSDLRKYWLSILMIVTSSRSSINIRHLEKATVSTGKEGLLSEGNAAYNWSRCVDELESQLARHGSLMKLYFYHHHLTAVFRNTMFGPEGRPQHCCAWLGVASSFPECASAIVPDELNKVGRDSILYVESLIESIMGGLEGLINILDSEGGFGSLEMQLVPEQAAFCLNNVLKGSTASFKSPKGWSMQKPGYESYPENTSSVKMLEAAMQRLTNLCSVLNDMEPVCVLNHVFVLREYMRECILGNFRRRLLAVMITDNCLQRPSIIESLLQRHIGIIHMAEQHISMDITEGIREVLLTESFTGPVSYLQKFEKPTEMQTGSAIELVGNWYLENIVKDISGAGVLFIPIRHCFKSSQVIGACTAESYTDVRELKALIRIFGGYGFDRIDRLLKEHTAALLNCIDTALRSNREALEGLAGSVNYGDRIEREANIKQLLDLDTLVGFCIQAGQAIAFHKLLVEAAGAVLEENAPLILSLLRGVANQLPVDIPEKDDITRLRRLANTVGADEDHDTEWIHAIMAEVGVANDSSWSFLPYLCSAFMASNIWSMTTYNVNTGGFNNNVHCLARCINAVIAGSEYVRMERVQEPRSLSNGHAGEISEPETLNRTSVEANIKSALQIFVKCSAGIVLDSWSENSRTYIVPKLIFLDQLCELSRYLPRSTLEIHIPYTILRSIYRQHYGNSATMITELLAPSPRQSPLISLTHASPAVRPHRGDSTPMPYDPGYLSSSIHRHDDAHEGDSLRLKTSDKQQRNTRSSGPLEYSSSRKVKFAEGSSSGGQGPSPLLRFAVSRSGPLSYK
ncbi:Membrane-associated apoptosis protein [Musa troglodytarum]|uniref:Membrane-associated apoptosis protein n=1 Tax=Musa troglodytarum TaxID=320322 RepID=A0A9E7L885_9LILI|nr:Membrane-associated apoptosis protein [Musa troglodytarum]